MRAARARERDEKRDRADPPPLNPQPAPPLSSSLSPHTLQVVDPWTVTAGADGKIDYDKLSREVRRKHEKAAAHTAPPSHPHPSSHHHTIQTSLSIHTHARPPLALSPPSSPQFGCSLIDDALIKR